ncbi:uncharacterized protein LOC128547253 [Mercenaria mercenaria]|uniref:uncharacterized protein LOC128547253 n=1 Tax=Mercenaria mercenaria TaxID=6596 RepID=UPI001E1D95A6|nr:uncharacterized protein LOC128547253 [Mercenaria mercenaria]
MNTRRKRKDDSVFRQTLNTTPGKLRKMSEKIDKLKELNTENETKYLDLAFAMDCTGSMQSYIDEARDNIYKIVEGIVASEESDVRLALVEYRDHPPEDSTFVTRCHDFTHSPRIMKGWLSDCSATGGGDTPEAVADALHDLLKLSWREEATKICVCISDAPPHGLGCRSDGFPDGCPDGIDPVVVSRQLAEKGITLYVAGCEPSISPYKDFFMALAYITGGQYVPMRKAQVLSTVIICGAHEELSLNQLMAEVDAEVQTRVEAGEDVNEHTVSGLLHGRWKARGQQAVQLQMDNTELSSVLDSPDAKKYSKMKTLTEIRGSFKEKNTGSGIGTLFGRPASACGFGASLFGRSTATACSSSSSGAFGAVETGVSFAQSSRLVQKSIAKFSK